MPTVVGRAFLREAEAPVNASWRARAAARAGTDELVGELMLAVQMGSGARQLPGAPAALRRRYPGLAADRVDLRELDGEPWVRFDRDSALDAVLRRRPGTSARLARPGRACS